MRFALAFGVWRLAFGVRPVWRQQSASKVTVNLDPYHPIQSGWKRWTVTVDRRRKTTALKAPLHMVDDIIAELGAFDLGRALHQACEIVGDSLAGNRFVQAVDYEVCRFFPA
jgi:hypothetical protein